MREASESRTVTGTDSYAFLCETYNRQRGDDRGKYIILMSRFAKPNPGTDVLLPLILMLLIPLYTNALSREGAYNLEIGESKTIAIGSAYQTTLSRATHISYYWQSEETSKVSVTSSTKDWATIKAKGYTTGPVRLYYHCSYTVDGFYRTMDFYYEITVGSGSSGSGLVQKISIVPSSATIDVGGKVELAAVVLPDGLYDVPLSWSSSNPAVAMVSSSGTVNGIAEGTATIYCRANDGSGVYGTSSVTVKSNNSDRFVSNNVEYHILSEREATVEVSHAWNENMTTIDIPATVSYRNKKYTVTEIGSKAFLYCGEMLDSRNYPNPATQIILPPTLTKIGENAFAYCENLTKLDIPNSVYSIGKFAFWSCTGLISVSLPNSLTTIDFGVFSFCGSLESIDLPNTIISIGDSAFSSCRSLTTVMIPNSVISIEMDAFAYCFGLKEVFIGSGVTSLGDRVFCNCNDIENITSFATNPPVCGKEPFNAVKKNRCQLHVPEQSVEAYASADCWKDFFNIDGGAGVDDVTMDGSSDFMIDGCMIDMSGIDRDIRVVIASVDGVIKYDGVPTRLELPRGIYIVNIGGVCKKIKI